MNPISKMHQQSHAARPPRSVAISIVSHGQGALVSKFLEDLRTIKGVDEVIVTFNRPEDQGFLSAFPELRVRSISNGAPKGFGANHNAAFEASSADVFVVANPDIRAPGLVLDPLIETLKDPAVGACAPLILSARGTVEDSARRFPTLIRFMRRQLLKQRGPDYAIGGEPIQVDWVAGMFVAFRREVYAAVHGFDERFFMYLEDADICRRLRACGLEVVLDPRCKVIHDARRASHRSLQHFAWHARSAVRFLSGV